MWSSISLFSINLSLKKEHKVCFVRSSLVGPNPPVRITSFALFPDNLSALIISSFLSEILVICTISIPILFSAFAKNTELVFTI